MDTLFDPLEFPFITPRKPRKLKKYAILLNEPNTERAHEIEGKPCSLAEELLPLEPLFAEDLVQIIGDILKSIIKTHSETKDVPIFKADEIISKNSATLVPVMYRIAIENFAQANGSMFKIIECRNVTKLISDWKPSLPDKLISLGHQVIVVQLEESFVPYTDFAYAILRQLDCDWKNRLPRSFFFPDDVCKVEATPERDLCVVLPSMPDGDLEINKKMGLLNYELLMMIKSSCMSAMKNYLMKRDLRVGKFSDTLDGVAALRQLYRKLQERLKTGQAIELGSNSLEDLRKLVKQAIGGTDVLAAQTWIEYGNRMGLNIPASTSSSATSISSVATTNTDHDDQERDSCKRPPPVTTSSSSSSGFDVDDGKDCRQDRSSYYYLSPPSHSLPPAENERSGSNVEGASLGSDVRNGNDEKKSSNGGAASKQGHTGNSNQEDDNAERDGGLDLEDFTEFTESLEKLRKTREVDGSLRDGEDEDQEGLPEYEFSADSIIQILQLPGKA